MADRADMGRLDQKSFTGHPDSVGSQPPAAAS
jgi:hypothetical protein